MICHKRLDFVEMCPGSFLNQVRSRGTFFVTGEKRPPRFSAAGSCCVAWYNFAMLIGVPREIKDDENRVGLLPSGVESLVAAGHHVVVETQSGAGIGISDAD